MAPRHLSNLAAVRKQHLLIEFSSLKYACPHGVFVSLTPGDPSLWSGVLCPYAPSVLRFQISFPPTYPSLPPLVTFSTDMFHPLITPLTTYMYTTDTQNGAEGTVSATDEERLPPGGFSLRAGFPTWFGRRSRRRDDNGSTMGTPGKISVSGLSSPVSVVSGASETPRSVGGSGTTAGSGEGKREEVGTYEVLRYIRSTFDDAAVLDAVPLEAAGNPGAWHAWRTHRVKSGQVMPTSPPPVPLSEVPGSDDGTPEGYKSLAGGGGVVGQRRPGEWNWDGVWEVRVRKGVDNSVAEAVLFGKEAGDDLIRFLNLDEGEIGGVMERIRESVEGAQEDAQRRAAVQGEDLVWKVGS
ncbi:ubiquitin-conjugating enzyme [Drepanopeziza brunnea f. sp. 'multigermtubi' MB_m1]|uniref:Ubiquitin-conjugating enzyme n=1 Tax=Marssonina brunnea f. sp. multigermtubi (strain MB_m1) TaxID=1072389 RepID=K1WLU6_MARBU|nr:ubiquitin-conjugating enzyme [Drepanopeziza brunnea f. sp. 'multigermtubi' MB_m1]EKD18650.1 ubiquitin-conjugating enzyme [Drepanopeziza brunnea f. sp. 'multigermtubi' MB_m1]